MKMKLVIEDPSLEQLFAIAGALDAHQESPAPTPDPPAQPAPAPRQPAPPPATRAEAAGQPDRVATDRAIRYMLDEFAKNGYSEGQAAVYIREVYPDVPVVDKHDNWIIPKEICSNMIDELKAGHVEPGPAAGTGVDFNA